MLKLLPFTTPDKVISFPFFIILPGAYSPPKFFQLLTKFKGIILISSFLFSRLISFSLYKELSFDIKSTMKTSTSSTEKCLVPPTNSYSSVKSSKYL